MSEMFLISRTADFPRHQWPLLHGNYIVGRSRDCDIVLFDETVSREHATVMVDNNVVKVTDCGSRNGTHVGDHRLAVEEVVAIGTTVRFGRIECLLVDSHMLQAFEESECSTIPFQTQKTVQLQERLSDAERRVLPLLLEGLSEKQVAHRLSLSPNTIHHHVGAIYRTLNVSSRGELLALLLRSRTR